MQIVANATRRLSESTKYLNKKSSSRQDASFQFGASCLAFLLAVVGRRRRQVRRAATKVARMASKDKQIVSKDRVRDHGEVFTAEREVKAMVDLVDSCATTLADKTFLEPACGKGNFLIEILNRKLDRVIQDLKERRLWNKRNGEFIAFSLTHALSLLYGIDIIEDNAADCRTNLVEIVLERFDALMKGGDKSARELLETACRVVTKLNIVHGDALTMKDVSEGEKPLVFVKWRFEAITPNDRLRVGITPIYFEGMFKEAESNLFAADNMLARSGQLPFYRIIEVEEFMKGIKL